MFKRKSKTLADMPLEVKKLYVKILACQTISDEEHKPEEVSDLYMFMTQLSFDSGARREIRKFLEAEEKELSPLLVEIITGLDPEDQKIVEFSIIKDLVRTALVDGEYSGKERANVELASRLYYGDKAKEKMELAEKIAKRDDDFIRGRYSSIDEFLEQGKKLASGAAAIGVPLAAVYFSGTVGFSAVGIVSGLGALGLGGLAALGISSMVAGIGVVVLIGLGTYGAAHFVLNLPEREKKKRRESLIQEIIKLHQRAISALAEDINDMASRQEKLASQTEANKAALAHLQGEIGILKTAMQSLSLREKKLCEIKTQSS